MAEIQNLKRLNSKAIFWWTVPGSLRIEERGLRQIVLEVGGGRLEALNLIPQASPLKQFPSNLRPPTKSVE
jgi:hypothetical protein